jgi:hypothetical protein
MIYEGSTVSLLAAENETLNVASEDVLTPMKKNDGKPVEQRRHPSVKPLFLRAV